MNVDTRGTHLVVSVLVVVSEWSTVSCRIECRVAVLGISILNSMEQSSEKRLVAS